MKAMLFVLRCNEEEPRRYTAQDGDGNADLQTAQERSQQNGWKKSDEGNIVEDAACRVAKNEAQSEDAESDDVTHPRMASQPARGFGDAVCHRQTSLRTVTLKPLREKRVRWAFGSLTSVGN
jgi:hypothetical protein